MANPVGSITDPGTTAPPYNKADVSIVDVYGDTASMRFGIIRTATTTDDILLLLDAAALSNGGINNAGVTITLQSTEGTPESGENDSVSTKGMFVFRDPIALVLAHYELPAPHASIFQSDHITVNRANSGVVTFFTSLAAIGCYTSGNLIVPTTDIRNAYRFQKRGNRPHTARFRE